MAAREIPSPWVTTDPAIHKRAEGDFSVYDVPADQPDPVKEKKASPAQESVVSSVSPTPSAATSENPANAEKEQTLLQQPLTVMPPL